jgi:Big-like domain-containing protein
MPLDQDGKLRGPTYAGGPPPERSSEDVPRWAFILIAAVVLTLLLALVRFAIDLLGVVFLIILVGFSIRTVSDWLTEGESVSAWAVSAVSTGLIGTMLVGLWIFSSPEISGTAITDRLPRPVVASMQWLEARGWGQRVLLSRPATLNANGAMATRGPRELFPAGSSDAGGSAASPPSEPVGELPVARPVSPKRASAHPRRDTSSEAEASTLDSREATRPNAPAADIATTVTLKSWPVPAVVGKSVRLTATVHAGESSFPSGMVTFYSNGAALGSLPVNATEPGRADASFVTLSLPIGTHEITARFTGASGFSGSQSVPLGLTVVRK